MELLLGCGASRVKKITPNGDWNWHDLYTLDINPDHNPNIIYDMNELPLPFSNDSIDEIHVYEVLEHQSSQGEYNFFFNQFSDFYRILKPNGFICGSCPLPNNPWTYGDPGHCRQISKESFHFLNQTNYTKEIGHTCMTDYRFIYKEDFQLIWSKEDGNGWWFVLQAIKPSRLDYGTQNT
jgi:predicted SAM-dependent methyltransferase